MNFIEFSCGKNQYFTHLLCLLAKYCFHHSKIKFISLGCCVISSIYLAPLVARAHHRLSTKVKFSYSNTTETLYCNGGMC